MTSHAVSPTSSSQSIASPWQPQPLAASFVLSTLETFLDGSTEVKRLADSLRDRTGTRLIDWIDHFALPDSDRLQMQLEQTGFVSSEQRDHVVWEHPDGLFPHVIAHNSQTNRLAISIDSVADFLSAQGMEDSASIEGEPDEALRKARISEQSNLELWVVERHGYRGWETRQLAIDQIKAVRHYAELFQRRQRHFADSALGFAEAQRMVHDAVTDLGTGRASELFFAAERDYWTLRNRAAQFQKARQDALGLGWGNHDHHTYRSSRAQFAPLVGVLEQMGLVCRERFYAGREAGWGAQVMEQPESRVVVFADVDLSADEVSEDFAHAPLPPQAHYGTVGLWCMLHGEAFLESGMHHLECRFDFDAAGAQFRQAGFRVMKPFTDLPHLKQAFTEGERWAVAEERLAAALAAEAITEPQAEKFRAERVVGSHLEILERDEGYKGFNQSGINEIIRATDPRRQVTSEPATVSRGG